MSEKTVYYMVMQLLIWENAFETTGWPIPVSFKVGDCVGFAPIYQTREAAEADYPQSVIVGVSMK